MLFSKDWVWLPIFYRFKRKIIQTRTSTIVWKWILPKLPKYCDKRYSRIVTIISLYFLLHIFMHILSLYTYIYVHILSLLHIFMYTLYISYKDACTLLHLHILWLCEWKCKHIHCHKQFYVSHTNACTHVSHYRFISL